jgi:hypothetical protein
MIGRLGIQWATRQIGSRQDVRGMNLAVRITHRYRLRTRHAALARTLRGYRALVILGDLHQRSLHPCGVHPHRAGEETQPPFGLRVPAAATGEHMACCDVKIRMQRLWPCQRCDGRGLELATRFDGSRSLDHSGRFRCDFGLARFLPVELGNCTIRMAKLGGRHMQRDSQLIGFRRTSMGMIIDSGKLAEQCLGNHRSRPRLRIP